MSRGRGGGNSGGGRAFSFFPDPFRTFPGKSAYKGHVARPFSTLGGFLMKKKKWIGILVVLLALGGVAFMKAKNGKTDPKAENTPFRLGKVQAEDLQVSVREVGVVDPVTKVEVKSAVSGKVIALKVREGALVKQGDVLAEIEPDVNQAQSLSDVQAGVKDAELKLKDAERDFTMQKALFEQGLLGSDAYRASQIKRDQAQENLR